MKEPLVYIILVNYNSLNLTRECIISLENITYKNYKILIVDNSPSKKFDEEMKSNFSSVIILRSITNAGFTGGNNIGINYALENEAEYIVLLNNDTTVEKNFLEPLIETFDDDSVGLVTGKIMYTSDRNKIWYGGGRINWFRGSAITLGNGKIDNGEYDNKSEVSFASGCLFCLKRSTIEKVGLLNEDYFAYLEDADFCFRLNKMGFIIIYEPRSKIFHHINATTKKSNFPSLYYQFRNRLYFIQTNSPSKYKSIGYLYVFSMIFIKSIYWILIMDIGKVRHVINALRDFSRKKMGFFKG